MNCIDLFSGCGGLTLGLNRAGIHGIFAVEKSPDAFMTLQHNLMIRRTHFDWPAWLEKKAHDINILLEKHLADLLKYQGKVDLLAGGPPCQGFSLAGRRKKTDKRNSLIESYIKMVKIIQPSFILLENVRGFTVPFVTNGKETQYSSDVVRKLRDLGYYVDFKLIDFAEFGVPQHRTRFILVGVRKKNGVPNNAAKEFFSKLYAKKDEFLKLKGILATNSVRDAIGDLLLSNGTYSSDEFPRFQFGKYGKTETPYQKLMRADTKTDFPDSHRFARHNDAITTRFSIAIKEQLSSAAYRSRFDLKKSSTKCLNSELPTPTLTTLPDDYIHYSEPRILTVREYARIQSFPDDFVFLGKYTTGGKRRVLEVPRYSQIGNAIPPLFGEIAGCVLMEMKNAYNN